MNSEALQHRLTAEERRQFEESGYLLIPDALSQDMLHRLTERADALYDKARQSENVRANNLYEKIDFLSLDPLFLELIDLPTVILKVVDLLSWNICLFHTHMNITPPRLKGVDEQVNLWNWHQDNGQVNLDLKQALAPRLSIKVAFYLTDVTAPNSGNTYVIPGSHGSTERPESPRSGVLPKNAVCLQGKPGTALLLDQRIWHTSSPNLSPLIRKVLFLGYGYRWLYPLDPMQVESLVDSSDPIRRQLLGRQTVFQGGEFSNRYYPSAEDVPLLKWLNEHVGKENVVQPARMY